LSTYADVTAALRDPRLTVSGSERDREDAHIVARTAGRQGLSSARLSALCAESATNARALVEALPTGEPVDLMRAFASPWSMALAVAATGAPTADIARLDGLSREIFLAA